MKWNTNYFIDQAKLTHGDKYDYSKSVCNSATDRVVIICPKHGEFLQQARCHTRGQGCPKCARENNTNYKSSVEYFMQRVRGRYHDKLDYSNVVYKDCLTPVCIICHKKDKDGNEHGEFWITPHDHISNCGCPKCKSEALANHPHKRSNTEDFIKKARKVHGDKYDYSKVEYVNNRTKVCIICPEHGEFWQIPSSHLKGEGCNKCSKKVYNTETFIEQAKKIHAIQYDYSKVEYVNNQTKVCIICPIHGEFWVTPANFNNTSGRVRECPKCQIEKRNESHKSNIEEFIQKAKAVHGDKYDYSKVEYVKSTTKVCIICPEHGEFWMTPNKHLMGESCPKCNISHMERDVMNLLDRNHITYIKEFSPSWAHKKRYDFCIEDKKVIIECQGEQHYVPVDFAHNGEEWANELFERNQHRDRIKKRYADENGYKVIYYTDTQYQRFGEIKDLNELLNIIKSI